MYGQACPVFAIHYVTLNKVDIRILCRVTYRLHFLRLPERYILFR